MKIVSFLETFFWKAFIGFLFYNQYKYSSGIYTDVETYMQAVRAKFFVTSGTWLEQPFVLSNYPEGEILSVTHLWDFIWVLCGLPFVHIPDMVMKMYYSGMFNSAMSVFFMLLFFVFGTKYTLPMITRNIAIILVILQKQIYSDFMLGHVNSTLWVIVFIIFVWINLWNFSENNDRTHNLFFVSLGCALLNWLAPEGVILSSILFLGLFISWLLNKISIEYVSSCAFFFALLVSLFFIINPPAQGYQEILLSRLSLWHVVIAWIFYVVFRIVRMFGIKKFVYRFLVFMIVMPSLLFAIYFTAGSGNLMVLPMSPYDTLTAIFGERFIIIKQLYYPALIYPILATFLGICLLFSSKFGSMSVVTLLWVMVSVVASYMNEKYYALAAIVSVLMLVIVLEFFYTKRQKVTPIFALLTGLFICVEFAILKYFPLKVAVDTPDKVHMSVIKDVVELYNYRSGTVLSDVFTGPLILWYTSHNVVATPNFSNRKGILDANKIWKTENPKECFNLLDKHKVDYVFLPERYDEKYFEKPNENINKLYGQVITGKNLPKWLKLMNDNQKVKYRLYKVQRDKTEEMLKMFEPKAEQEPVEVNTIFLPDF